MAELVLPDGSVHELSPTAATTVGSADDATLRVEGAAEMHCAIRPLQNGGFGLKDLGAQGGTLVNGQPVRAVRLSHGDAIRVGPIEPGVPPPRPGGKAYPEDRRWFSKAPPGRSRP